MNGSLKFEFKALRGEKGLKFWLLSYVVILSTVIIFLNLIYTQDSILSSNSISFLAIENYGVHMPAIPAYFKMIIAPIFFILGIVLFIKTIGFLFYIVLLTVLLLLSILNYSIVKLKG
ncbi:MULTISPECIES: hypothetical protein [Bacillus]|uniref:hypothetical protein n=1 Tax=Bacillus TaxID=1386 RepID=UPI00190A1B7F|nr:hypothetical protein [Bacillus cereus]MBK4744287.1 hypothetical protein [Bacillus cereus]